MQEGPVRAAVHLGARVKTELYVPGESGALITTVGDEKITIEVADHIHRTPAGIVDHGHTFAEIFYGESGIPALVDIPTPAPGRTASAEIVSDSISFELYLTHDSDEIE